MSPAPQLISVAWSKYAILRESRDQPDFMGTGCLDESHRAVRSCDRLRIQMDPTDRRSLPQLDNVDSAHTAACSMWMLPVEALSRTWSIAVCIWDPSSIQTRHSVSGRLAVHSFVQCRGWVTLHAMEINDTAIGRMRQQTTLSLVYAGRWWALLWAMSVASTISNDSVSIHVLLSLREAVGGAFRGTVRVSRHAWRHIQCVY